MTPERVLVVVALVGVAGALAAAVTVGRGDRASQGPAPVAAMAPPPAAPVTTAPVVSLRTPLPPLPAGLLARAAGAKALEREPCPPAAGGAEGAANAAADGRCEERREAVEIRWHVWDEN